MTPPLSNNRFKWRTCEGPLRLQISLSKIFFKWRTLSKWRIPVPFKYPFHVKDPFTSEHPFQMKDPCTLQISLSSEGPLYLQKPLSNEGLLLIEGTLSLPKTPLVEAGWLTTQLLRPVVCWSDSMLDTAGIAFFCSCRCLQMWCSVHNPEVCFSVIRKLVQSENLRCRCNDIVKWKLTIDWTCKESVNIHVVQIM